jgi:prepilin-type N-terminal cleavage/methylation domain-containing protein
VDASRPSSESRLHHPWRMSAGHGRSEQGFTLVEVLVASSLLIVAATGLAQLVGIAARANHRARGLTTTAFLAAQKMEQLRSLSWAYDAGGGLRSDTSTDVSREPLAGGGLGLSTTPSGSLERNLDGCADYVDASGHWLGTGTTPPGDSAYVRRWAVLPAASDPSHARVLVVLAAALEEERQFAPLPSPRPHLPQDSVLVTLKVRQAGTT